MLKSIFFAVWIYFSAISIGYAVDGNLLTPKNLGTIKLSKGADKMQADFFSFEENGLVTAGYNVGIKFVINAPVKRVWPYFKDFNSWFNGHGYYLKAEPGDGVAVPGDMEGQMMQLGSSAKGPWGLAYTIDTVIPNHLIVLTEIPRKREGHISFGHHVFMLTSYDGKTLVTVFMQHATRSASMTVKEMLVAPRKFVSSLAEKENFWTESLIPKLRSLVVLNK